MEDIATTFLEALVEAVLLWMDSRLSGNDV
jgi:hypothetical protein